MGKIGLGWLILLIISFSLFASSEIYDIQTKKQASQSSKWGAMDETQQEEVRTKDKAYQSSKWAGKSEAEKKIIREKDAAGKKAKRDTAAILLAKQKATQPDALTYRLAASMPSNFDNFENSPDKAQSLFASLNEKVGQFASNEPDFINSENSPFLNYQETIYRSKKGSTIHPRCSEFSTPRCTK